MSIKTTTITFTVDDFIFKGKDTKCSYSLLIKLPDAIPYMIGIDDSIIDKIFDKFYEGYELQIIYDYIKDDYLLIINDEERQETIPLKNTNMKITL